MEKKVKYDKYDAGKAFFLAVLSPQILGIIFVLALATIAFIVGKNYEEFSTLSAVSVALVSVSQVAFIVVFFAYNKIHKINVFSANQIDFKLSIVNIIMCLVISVAAIFGISNLVGVVEEFFKYIGYNGNFDLPVPLNTVGWLLFNLFFLAVLPAIFEELLFRGMIFNGLKQYGKYCAVFLSAVLFALMHGSLVQFVYPFALGVILAFVVLKTRNILYAIIIHFLNNAIVIVVNFVNEINNVVAEPIVISVQYVMFAILFAVAGGAVIFAVITWAMRAKKQHITFKDIKVEDVDIQNINHAQQVQGINIYGNQLGFDKYLIVGIIVSILLLVVDIAMGFGA